MQRQWLLASFLTALLVAGGGVLTAPLVFGGRVLPGITLAGLPVGGVDAQDLPGVLAVVEKEVLSRSVTVRLKEREARYTIQQLGVEVDRPATTRLLQEASRRVSLRPRRLQPAVTIDELAARKILHKDFADNLNLPKNAGLVISRAGTLEVEKSRPGEQVDVRALTADIQRQLALPAPAPIELVIASAPATVQDSETEAAKIIGEQLLREGLKLSFEDEEFIIKPFTVRRLLAFVEQVEPRKTGNTILGVQLNPEGLREYLKTTLAPAINQEAVNARFEVEEGDGGFQRVTQFAVPQRGQALDVEESAKRINMALTKGDMQSPLAVAVTQADVSEAADITALGITSLLARGDSDFAGSPKNRIHNIRAGAQKYHGLLIAPNEEFSFNKFLGPVDASGGFLPELVIKQNVTTPEYGGGLCQVSTTVFRAAALSGMKITNRRNHSYAVTYYGTPGFDATIYPPYTDFRFLNNTPGYILVQSKIDGTKLAFEFWGTDDGRTVEIAGPTPYNRQSDGAVKATLSQKVILGGQAIIEDTFYSNYKSPKLFPKVLAANGERPPVNEPTQQQSVAASAASGEIPPH